MNNELYQMRRDLMQLKSDCEDFLKASQAETEVLDQIRPAATPPINNKVPPISADQAPATESKQKQWRFMNEAGQIPESIVRKAVTDPNLLEQIAAEIEQRASQARQD
jgi:hypothetical protein